MSEQAPPHKPKKYVWDYLRGGGGNNPLTMLTKPFKSRFAPDSGTLRRRIELERLRQELARTKKKTSAEDRVAI